MVLYRRKKMALHIFANLCIVTYIPATYIYHYIIYTHKHTTYIKEKNIFSIEEKISLFQYYRLLHYISDIYLIYVFKYFAPNNNSRKGVQCSVYVLYTKYIVYI